MKNLTKSDVFDVATDLIEENGSTTTLDVKNELRARGFFAKQADVSEHMLAIADSENWNFTYTGVHRQYTASTAVLRGSAATPATLRAQSVQTQTRTIAPVGTYTKRNGDKIVAIDKSLVEPGDFRVWSVTHDTELYFVGTVGYSRSDIRFAYAKLTGADFVDTRIKMVK